MALHELPFSSCRTWACTGACPGEHAAELALLLMAFDKILQAARKALTMSCMGAFLMQDLRVYGGASR